MKNNISYDHLRSKMFHYIFVVGEIVKLTRKLAKKSGQEFKETANHETKNKIRDDLIWNWIFSPYLLKQID